MTNESTFSLYIPLHQVYQFIYCMSSSIFKNVLCGCVSACMCEIFLLSHQSCFQHERVVCVLLEQEWISTQDTHRYTQTFEICTKPETCLSLNCSVSKCVERDMCVCGGVCFSLSLFFSSLTFSLYSCRAFQVILVRGDLQELMESL